MEIQILNKKVVVIDIVSKFVRILPFKNRKKVFLMATPDHHNMGDHAIAIAELKWINNNFPGYEILEFSESNLMQNKHFLLRLLPIIYKKGDFVFMHGGGNLGERYLSLERLRRNIIKFFKNAPIIMFPQSMYFSNSERGQLERSITAKVYNSHKNLTLLFREETSYKNGKQLFSKCKTLLVPDMVTYIANDFPYPDLKDRDGILFCIRDDIESYYNKKLLAEIEEKLSQSGIYIEKQDTLLQKSVSQIEREKELENLLERFRKVRVVITDRFHGVIFSVITHTPCIALRSSDHKIIDGIKWFKDLDYIFYAEDVSKVQEFVNIALNKESRCEIDFGEKYFNNLKKLIIGEYKQVEYI
jgi:pyruvyl transferase EpsI